MKMENSEKRYTLEDVIASTHEAETARYHFVGCMYKTLLEEMDEEKANELMYKAYFKYGHTKHPSAEIVPGSLKGFCETYARGEHTYYPYSMDMPYEIKDDTAVMQWCTDGCCIGLDWFAETGLTPEQVRQLCWKGAVAGDIGYADKCGLDAYFTKTCATGDGHCEIVLKKRK